MEEYEWINRESLKDIPKNQLLRLVVKTTLPTDHTNDKTLPPEERLIRIYPEEELRLAARSLIHKPVGLNHAVSTGGFVVDSEWSEKNKRIEAYTQVPEIYVNLARAKKITTCSAEIFAREAIREGNTLTYKGVWLDGVSLVQEPFRAGDSQATVNALENLIFVVEAIPVEEIVKAEEIVDQNEKGEWCVYHCHGGEKGEVIKCFPTKEEADAMHRAIMANKETAAIKEAQVIAEKEEIIKTKEKELADKNAELETKNTRITELEGAVTKLQENAKNFDTKLATETAAAKKEGKNEVISKVEATLPAAFIMRNGVSGLQILTQKIKGVIRECSKDEL